MPDRIDVAKGTRSVVHSAMASKPENNKKSQVRVRPHPARRGTSC